MTGPPPLFYPHDPPAASPLLPHALVLAPPRLRLAAQLIDLAAVGALSVLVAVTTRGTPAVALLVIVLYPSVMTALCGGTAGKLA
ncbi:MAG: hypothetical protein HOY71_15525, partial [Nonomuraea sp.]|nr:hypothetical protein [Nonomuraea sp.]